MVERFKRHTGIESDDRARDFLETALRAFAESLTWKEAERLASELPDPASRWFMEVEHGRLCSFEELRRRIQQRTGAPTGIVLEWVPAALAALRGELSPQTRQELARKLGDEWGAVFRTPHRSFADTEPRARRNAETVEPHTLAEGRPGSARPLSESRPSPQPDSVGERNPYGDRKLSSATPKPK